MKSLEPSKLATLLGDSLSPHPPSPAEITRWPPCPSGIYLAAGDLNSGPHAAISSISLAPSPPLAVLCPFSKRVSNIDFILSVTMRSCGRFQVRLEPALLPASEMPVFLLTACDFHGPGAAGAEVHLSHCVFCAPFVNQDDDT